MGHVSEGQLQISSLQGRENTHGKRGELHRIGLELHDLLYAGFGARGPHCITADASGIDVAGRTWAVTARVRADAVGITVHGSFGTTTREIEIWPQRPFHTADVIDRVHTAVEAAAPELARNLVSAIEKHQQHHAPRRDQGFDGL